MPPADPQALENRCPHLHAVGRDSRHQDNDQASLITKAILTIKNIRADAGIYNTLSTIQDAQHSGEDLTRNHYKVQAPYDPSGKPNPRMRGIAAIKDLGIKEGVNPMSRCNIQRRDQDGPKVSVVIPVFRGRLTIGECLQSVLTAVQGFNHEIIVVESSGDGAVALVQARFPRVRVITSDKHLSAGEARNVGIRHARGEFLFCVDQDCIVHPDWIDRHLGNLQRPGVGAVGGAIAVANKENISGWCVYFLEFLHHFPVCSHRLPKHRYRSNFLIGANSAWRAVVFRDVQFPNQTLGEDLLMSQAVQDLGFEVLHDPSIIVYHYNRQGWREFHRYCRAMGAAAAVDQARIGGRCIRLIQRYPLLVYGIPLLVIPLIAWRLLKAPRGYLVRYIALLPCCIIGQFAWADAFRHVLMNQRDA